MSAFDDLRQQQTEAMHLQSALSLLSWDQEVMIPEGSNAMRAQTLSILSGMHHNLMVNQVWDCLKRVEDEGLDKLDAWQMRNYKVIHKEVSKSLKLPKAHVMELGRLRGEALGAWVQAKKDNNFAAYAPMLSAIVDNRRKEAEYLGYEEHPYDALLDTYEPEMTASRLKAIFEPFKLELGDLLPQIAAQQQIDDSFLNQEIAADKQLAWSREVLQKMGYDFSMGRQDLSAHPFSISMNPQDVRITTMVHSHDIREMLYSSIHEGGHALYEQGLPLEHFGMPAANACSLGIHESQSRIWENNIARSQEFCAHFFPSLRQLYPDALKGKTEEDLFKAVNKVQPGFIRISADELTYHFHVLLRFEIELALVNQEIEVADLPAIWNEKVAQYLGLKVKTDTEGVLQDIHWAHGSIGYFPTYSLGSFYAAQLMAKAKEAIPGLDAQFLGGDFSQMKSWLNTNIHAYGQQYNSEDLCTIATGQPLDVKHFVRYAKAKFGQVYGFEMR